MDVDSARQLELFDEAQAEPERARAELLLAKDGLGGGPHAGGDRAVLKALEATLADARASSDDRPALVVLASRLGNLGTLPAPPAPGLSLRQARDDWLRRLGAQQKSESAIVAYRVAIDDLLDWSEASGRSVLEETTIVDYLGAYRQRSCPAPATYYRRFLLLPASSAGSGGDTASPTRSSISSRRRNPGRSATG